MGKIQHSVGLCIEAWMFYGLCMGGACPPKFLYYESSCLDDKYGFVKETVIVTVLLEWLFY